MVDASTICQNNIQKKGTATSKSEPTTTTQIQRPQQQEGGRTRMKNKEVCVVNAHNPTLPKGVEGVFDID